MAERFSPQSSIRQRNVTELIHLQNRISFTPAITSTSDRSRRNIVVGARELPKLAPIQPPARTAPAQKGICGGSCVIPARCPSSPATEFTRMKGAATPDVARVSAQPAYRRSGLRKIPPPTPVIPETNPITSPVGSATQSAGGRDALSATAPSALARSVDRSIHTAA